MLAIELVFHELMGLASLVMVKNHFFTLSRITYYKKRSSLNSCFVSVLLGKSAGPKNFRKDPESGTCPKNRPGRNSGLYCGTDPRGKVGYSEVCRRGRS